MPVVVYTVTQLGFLFWWVALYPGQLTWDSVTYIIQVTEDKWMTNHSVLYNVLVWFSLKASGSVAPLCFVQTVAMAVAIAYTAVGIRALGVRGRWLVVCAALLPMFPSIGLFTIYVSKDVPFVLAQILLVGTLARIVVHRRDSQQTGSSEVAPDRSASIAARVRLAMKVQDRRMRSLLWLIFAEMLGLTLFRQNGLLIAVAAAVVIAVLMAGSRTWFMVSGICAAFASLLANLVVFPALGVQPARSDLLLGPAYADIAMIYRERPWVVYAADRELMSRVAPLPTWRDNANCYSSDPTTHNLDLDAAAANSGAMFELWVRLVKRAPDIFIDTRLCRGTIAWNVKTGPVGTSTAGTVRIAITSSKEFKTWQDRLEPDNPYRSAIGRNPLNDKAYRLAVFVRRASGSDTLTPIIWRGAVWCYIAYLAVWLFARRRRDWSIAALVAVAFANQVVVLVNNPGQLSRYMMGPIFIGVLLLPLLFAGRSRSGRGERDLMAGEELT